MYSELIIPSLSRGVSEKEVRRVFEKHGLGSLTKFRDKYNSYNNRLAWLNVEWTHPNASKYITYLEDGGCLTLVSEFPNALYVYLKK